MELVNTLYQTGRPETGDTKSLSVIRETVEGIIILLSPIVPHMTEELWEMIGGGQPLPDTPWPSFDKVVAAEEEITIVVQVNGKVRSRLQVAASESDETIKELALSDGKIKQLIGDKQVIKEIYVPKKLVNIVVK